MTRFVEDDSVVSWGRTLRGLHRVARPSFRDEVSPLLGEAAGHGLLATGLRRSYGDSGLNIGGGMIDMSRLDRLIDFDPASGIVTAEAGMSLAELNRWSLARGWFVPVTPGTKWVTFGGCVANDVHGKNHHTAGTFGRWVRRLGLLRSDGTHQSLGPEDNTGLFAATVGGLGLTGIVTHVTLQLRRVPGTAIATETIPFGGIDDFFALVQKGSPHEYSVAWIDCLASGRALGRGLLTLADHSNPATPKPERRPGPTLPFDLPDFVLNRLSVSAFNRLYLTAGRMRAGEAVVPMESYFYPLDRIGAWNRMYGARGMFQYQSVVPPGTARAATTEMLRQISRAGEGSFLVVLKTFGSLPSPGMLSFPMEGTTLALDFPNRGETTHALLDRLDAIILEAGGRLYPAKDGRLPRKMFESGYPLLEQFGQHTDPGISSSFWRRMQG